MSEKSGQLTLKRFVYMCSTQERNSKLTTNAESVLHIYAVRHSILDYVTSNCNTVFKRL